MTACLLLIIANSACSSETAHYPLDKMTPNPLDKASLQRGAKYFMNYCFGCHSLGFQRYQRVAVDLEIPEDLMVENLIFNDAKITDFMFNGMTKEMGKEWFGIAPPDLTLAARVRGTDWLYTYLRAFYYDATKLWKANNLVFPNVGMPNVFERLQGKKVEICTGPKDNQNCSIQPDPEYPGTLSPQEFDRVVYDLVNFMAYSAEPMKVDRQRIGVYVLLFLFLFLILAYLLKREYWKDVH